MVMAMIVSLATFTLIEIVMKRSGEVASRVETTASARTAMDQITRQLRSQVCAKTTPTDTGRSLIAGSALSLTVYTDFTTETLTNGLLPAPDKRMISWASNTLTETVTKGKRLSDNTVADLTTPAPAKRAIVKNVVPADFTNEDKTKPAVFRYFKFPDLPAGATALPPNSTANQEIIGANSDGSLTYPQLATVAMISIRFKAIARTGGDAAATTLENHVYVRTADPNAQIPKPSCQTF
jgi:hypothetical protein